MHIALFGGSFDPPHNSHVAIAHEVLKELSDVSEVWFVPDNQHAWKPIVVSAQDRLTMLRFLEEKKIKTADIAIKRGGNTYTIDIVEELQQTTKHSYIWICGADQLKDFSRWKDYQELEGRIAFVIFPRIGYDIPHVLPRNFILMAPTDYVATDDNSTEIRERVKQGLPIAHLVPRKVEDYIKEHKLYK